MTRPAVMALGMALLTASARAQTTVETPRALRVVTDNAYAPYSFQSDEGGLQGIVIDQWRAWEKKTGIKVEIRAMDWGEALRRMAAGEFDVIDCIVETAERRAYFDFTPAYATVEASIFFRNEISGVSDLSSLRGFPVGVKTGDQHIDKLRANGVTTVVPFANNDGIVEAARQHKINVFLADAPSALYLLNKRGIDDEFRHSAPIFRDDLRGAVRKGNSELLRTVTEGFAVIEPSELGQINEKWFGSSINRYERYLTYAGYTAAAALLLIAALVGWNRTLKKVISLRTAALSESEQRFRRLVELMPVAVYECDASGRIQSFNNRAVELWGRSPRPGDAAERYCASLHLYSAEGKPVPHEESAMAEVLRTGVEARDQEVVIERPDGSRRTVLVNIVPLKNGGGKVVGALNCFLDITDRKQAEDDSRQIAQKIQALSAQKEDHLRLVIDTIPSMAWSLQPGGAVDFVNQRWVEYAGLSLKEALENSTRIVHPDDLPWVMERWGVDSAALQPSEYEMRLRRADGEYRWFLVRTVPLRDEQGNIVKWYGTSTDIEDRKRAEEKLKSTSEKLRALSARIRSAREEESTRIAREVHDEIGQALTALQLDVAWLGKKLDASVPPEPETLSAKLRSMSELIDETIGAVHRIATDLRPGVLDELGLEAAVEWHLREFENRTGIACRLHSDLNGAHLDPKRATTIFRILQEALTNVARHSGSTRVDIHLTADADHLRLEVVDDGRGLPEDRVEVFGSLGLLGMRERARSLGGDLSIGRVSPSGTSVTLTVPR